MSKKEKNKYEEEKKWEKNVLNDKKPNPNE